MSEGSGLSQPSTCSGLMLMHAPQLERSPSSLAQSEFPTQPRMASNMVSNQGWVRNPLSVIAIFAGLAEASGAAVLPLLNGNAQLIFMRFVMFFPCALVGLFFYVLWFKPKFLYAPGDYKNDESFKEMHGVFSKDGTSAPYAAQTSNSEPAVDWPASEQQDVDTPSQTTPEASDSESTPGPTEVREPAAPHGTSHEGEEERIEPKQTTITPSSETPKIEFAAFNAFLAEKKAITELQKRYGGVATAPAIMSATGTAPYLIDAFISNGDRQYFIEVVYASRPLKISRILGAGKRLTTAWDAVPDKDKGKTTCVLCIVSEQESMLERNASNAQSLLTSMHPSVNLRVERVLLNNLQ